MPPLEGYQVFVSKEGERLAVPIIEGIVVKGERLGQRQERTMIPSGNLTLI
jgi:hypothetical protein